MQVIAMQSEIFEEVLVRKKSVKNWVWMIHEFWQIQQ